MGSCAIDISLKPHDHPMILEDRRQQRIADRSIDIRCELYDETRTFGGALKLVVATVADAEHKLASLICGHIKLSSLIEDEANRRAEIDIDGRV